MSKFDTLKKFFQSTVQLPDEEWISIENHLTLKVILKGQFFFQHGEVFSDIGFVQKGLLVNFYTDSKGEHYVKKFSGPGAPVANYASQILNQKANYCCQAVEETTLFTLNYEVLKGHFDRHKCWERLGRLMAEKLYIEKEFREQHFLVSDAKTRYQIFLEQHPHLREKIPQYLVASYIGITPASLSRIKSEIVS
jgi:CRP-like cAMP-binding protein